MTADQDVLQALTAFGEQIRAGFREDLRDLRADLDRRFDALEARFDRLEAHFGSTSDGT